MKSVRKFCTLNNNKIFFVTTPIYYVNAAPHIGHLYSSVLADAIQRWHNLTQPNNTIKFATGTDEHGMKIQQAALNNKQDEKHYCKKISEKYETLFNTFSINYTDFIRTSSCAHKEAVHHFWKTIDKNGHIYSSQYQGWYCISDETFLSNAQVEEKIESNGNKKTVSTESGHPVEWTEEQNYMFRLSSFQDDLKYWLRKNENCVRPKQFHRILSQLADSDAMADVSISRPVSRVHWGIPVPGDSGHSVYVWMDALVNYLTAVGYPNTDSDMFRNSWPPDIQVIGKDILKFHGIYWPAFLMAAGLEPPKTLFCHSHWTVDDKKMSKSKNNVVCPFEKKDTYTSDGLRYFLLREGVAHSDGNYSNLKAIRILNSELADTLGNLLNRCSSKALNPNQEIPFINKEVFEKMSNEKTMKNVLDLLKKLPDTTYQHYTEQQFYKVVDSTMSTLHAANLFFETMKPWDLKKSPNSLDELNVVLYVAIDCLRVCGIILQPIIPNLCEVLLNKLHVSTNERFWNNIVTPSWETETNKTDLSKEKVMLYSRILTK